MSECRVCETPDAGKPQIFRGEDWCCDRHRKVVLGQVDPTMVEWKSMDQELYQSLGGLAGNE